MNSEWNVNFELRIVDWELQIGNSKLRIDTCELNYYELSVMNCEFKDCGLRIGKLLSWKKSNSSVCIIWEMRLQLYHIEKYIFIAHKEI